MKNRTKGKRIAALLAVTMLSSSAAFTGTVFAGEADVGAGEEPVKSAEEETYKYVYNNNEDWSISPHRVQVNYEDDTSSVIPVHMFRLDTAGETEVDTETDFAAYCCDIDTSIKTKGLYKRVNLEDSTYFDDGTAEKIRGIVTSGYWHDWEDSDVTAAENAVNNWLASNGKTCIVKGLTRAEAMTATQAAIWYTAGKLGEDENIESFLPYGNTADWSGYDPDDMVVDKRVNLHEKADENTGSNIKNFYDYLLSQPAKSANTVLFTHEHFILKKSAEENKYDVTLKLKLTGTVNKGDELKLKAILGERKEKEIILSGSDSVAPDKDGCYRILFEDVTSEELESIVKLSISGKQNTDDICFYEAKPDKENDVRRTSQNLVARVLGMTPVYAEDSFKLQSVIETPDEPLDPEVPDDPQSPEKEPNQQVPNNDKTVETVAYQPADNAPATGDSTRIILWAGLAVIALISGIIAATRRKFI